VQIQVSKCQGVKRRERIQIRDQCQGVKKKIQEIQIQERRDAGSVTRSTVAR
jgi:hypothetical protein